MSVVRGTGLFAPSIVSGFLGTCSRLSKTIFRMVYNAKKNWKSIHITTGARRCSFLNPVLRNIMYDEVLRLNFMLEVYNASSVYHTVSHVALCVIVDMMPIGMVFGKDAECFNLCGSMQ